MQEKKIVSVLYPKNRDMDKTWFIRVTYPNGEVRKIYDNLNKLSDVQARILLAERLIASVQTWQKRKTKVKRVRISDTQAYISAIERTYEQIQPLIRDNSKRKYKGVLKSFLAWKLSQPSAPTQAYVQMRVKAGIKSIANEVVIVRQFIRRAHELNPHIVALDLPTKPVVRHYAQSAMIFTQDELKALRSHILASDSPRFWLACLLQYYCYIRPNELRYIRVGDIDFSRWKIFLSGHFTKNKRDAYVSIPKVIREDLRVFEGVNKRYFLFSGKCFTVGAEMITRERWDYVFNRYKKALGLGARHTFYSFKHTGAVAAVQAGINLKAIQLQLRHHSLDMVNEYLKSLGALNSVEIDDKFPAI